MAVQNYRVRVLYWTRDRFGWGSKTYSSSGSRPKVAIAEAMKIAEFDKDVPRNGVAGAWIVDGPPGHKIPGLDVATWAFSQHAPAARS
jgi:hypothetical protein